MKVKLMCMTFCSLLAHNNASASSLDNVSVAIEELQPQQLSSVLVARDNELVYESYYNGTLASDLHDVRSLSKSLTGLMFGKAISDGYFESEFVRVLPIFDNATVLNPSKYKDEMTFFDLLTMTNPLECDDMNNLSAGHEERMYLTRDWVSFFLSLPARANPPWEVPMSEQPYGRDFSYCTAGISATAAAIEAVSEERFSTYTNTALFRPLGITEIEWLHNEEGITQGGGGLRIKPRDLIKIGELVLNNGAWSGNQIINSDWIEKSLQSYSVSMPEMNATYGITWWHFPFEVDGRVIETHAAAGNGGNYLFVIPELNTTVVVTATAYNTRYMHQQTHAILSSAILPALLD
ncbi:serine hydrolase domain-containing protein [Idiomarina ramblicola]|uniref:Serine hydrolase n=1 Tax=Idiomarina ramblicola TaxID=263724 RepID=A0A432Z0A1_9GAMM|nr:serine hydrolase [Idiomarina ramblicola]RUO69585.1 serine hydrolase [Idiomarina ramblicola]